MHDHWKRFLREQEQTTEFESIQIVGRPLFTSNVLKALKLIQEKAEEDYELTLYYIGQIRQWYQGGILLYAYPPTYFMAARTAISSITWCASCIAHETWHSKLYHDYWIQNPGDYHVPHEVYGGQAIEIECNKYQLQVGQKIGMPESEIEWLRQQEVHTGINKDGGRIPIHLNNEAR
jgi:hypothetical protein